MNRIDELLNKYIDGELLDNELEEVQLLLKQDENLKKLKALQVVENSLKTLERNAAPVGVTSKIMNAISAKSSKIVLSKNYFTAVINVIFALSILSVVVFALSFVNWNFSSSGIDNKVNEVIENINSNISPFLSFFKNKNVMFLGSSISLLLLLGAYYSIEAHKAFKKRLDDMTSR